MAPATAPAPSIPTTPTVAQRVRRCYELLLEGYTSAEIVKLAATNFQLAEEKKDHDHTLAWKISDRQIRSYCLAAKKDFEQIQALKREQALGSSLGRREHMYRKAMKLDRVNTALRVQDSIDRLMGLTGEFNPGGGTDGRPQGILLPGGQVVYL